MPLALQVADYAIVASMLAASAMIGLYFRFTGGRQKTTREFLMAGKDMSILPVAFSLMATYMSAISVLGVPSEVYMYGTQFIIWLVGIPVGSIIAAYMFLPIFFEMEASTAYEYLEKRFGKLTRSIISILFILQMILYMSIVLYAPSLALNAVTGLSTWTSVISLAVVCTFYCSLGGLKAVLWTDVLQSLMMYTTLISVIVKVAVDVGGLSKAYERAYNGGRIIVDEFTFDITVRYTFWNALVNGVYFSVSTFGTNQAQIQRLLSVRSLRRAQLALFCSVPLILVFTFLCFLDGAMIYALFHDCDPILDPSNEEITSQDQFMPYAILVLFGKYAGLSGLCICGVFGASLSTISSAVNSLTAVTMEDFIRPYCFCRKLTESWAAFIAKVVAVLYGGVCLLFTIIVANFRGVLEASNIVFGMVGGPVLGIFMLGMYTTAANEQGALIGLLAGFTFNAWLGFGSYTVKLEIPTLPRSTDGCPKMDNGTYDLLGNNFTADALVSNEEDEDVFVLYKIAYLWYTIFGCVITLIAGYLCSLVIGLCIDKQPVKESLISPVLRRFFFSSPEERIEELQTAKGSARNNGDAEANILHRRNHLTSSFAL